MKVETLKVAIVCDWLTGLGGAERVIFELHKIFPHAPIYTSQYNPKKVNWLTGADVRTTWIQKIPSSLKKFLPILRAYSFSQLDLSDYDLVVSVTGAEAKAVKTGKNTIHVSYINSPTHYYWMRYDAYIKDPGFGKLDWLARIGLKLFVKPLRKWDYKVAQRPDYIIANSNFTKANIKKYYHRDSVVINPPVDIQRFKSLTKQPRSGYVIAGRQTPYKKVDLAVDACSELSLDLKVIGNGPDHEKLIRSAGPTIEFLSSVSDIELPALFQTAKGFIFPGVDDFGIVAVEALAAGTPVIAYNEGGVEDYLNGSNGVLFNTQSIHGLAEKLQEFDVMNFDNDKVTESAQSFSQKAFADNIISFLNNL